MKKKWRLAALLPGFLTLNNSVSAAPHSSDTDFEASDDGLKGLVVAPLNANTPLYIAGHRSHRSHSSHGSHRSSAGSGSRSYSTPSPRPTPALPPSRYDSDPLGQPSTPNYTTPNNSSNRTTQKQFDRMTLIMRVQIALRVMGYYKGGADGIMGPETRASIKRYRRDKGLPSVQGIDALFALHGFLKMLCFQ